MVLNNLPEGVKRVGGFLGSKGKGSIEPRLLDDYVTRLKQMGIDHNFQNLRPNLGVFSASYSPDEVPRVTLRDDQKELELLVEAYSGSVGTAAFITVYSADPERAKKALKGRFADNEFDY